MLLKVNVQIISKIIFFLSCLEFIDERVEEIPHLCYYFPFMYLHLSYRFHLYAEFSHLFMYVVLIFH